MQINILKMWENYESFIVFLLCKNRKLEKKNIVKNYNNNAWISVSDFDTRLDSNCHIPKVQEILSTPFGIPVQQQLFTKC